MGIQIGDNNIIKNSVITSEGCSKEKKKWWDRHPVLAGAIASLIVGFILMFSFWDRIISYLEGLF